MPNLRPDSFMFLRKTPADLSRYLPTWLYSDPSFSAIQNALNEMHNAYRLKLQHVARQFFYQTADSEGLADWELFLKIPNVKEKDLELRRKIVSTKLLRNTVMTVENTKKLMREFLRFENDDVEVGVEELGNNQIQLILTNGDFYYDELFTALFDWLPAHLIFNFSAYEDFGEETIHYAQAMVDATHYEFNLGMVSPPPETIYFNTILVDRLHTTFNPDSADKDSEHTDFLQYGILMQQSISMTIDCDRSELLDEETIEDFERYIRKRWEQFRKNAVVKWYKHNNKGDDYDGEIDTPDDEEYFPVDTDFLRMYWAFDCPNDADGLGGKHYHYRYQTILQPRKDLSGKEINYLSAVGAAGKVLLHSKLNLPTTGIIKALYVKKTETKII